MNMKFQGAFLWVGSIYSWSP